MNATRYLVAQLASNPAPPAHHLSINSQNPRGNPNHFPYCQHGHHLYLCRNVETSLAKQCSRHAQHYICLLFLHQLKATASLGVQAGIHCASRKQPDFESKKNLSIHFKGQEINTLNKTWIILWNAGNAEITASQISKQNPLTIECDIGIILDAAITNQTNSDNMVYLVESLDKKSVRISFDYLNPKDGVALELLHSGPNSQIHITGSIIGSLKPKLVYYEKRPFAASRLTPNRPLQQENSLSSLIGVIVVGAIGMLALTTATGLPSVFPLLDIVSQASYGQYFILGIDVMSKAVLALVGAAMLWSAYLDWRKLTYRHPSKLSIDTKLEE
jgi:hypothetical protein